MRFEDFARLHGLIIKTGIIPNRWVATPTEGHPNGSAGRYKFLGDVGWVMDWTAMDKPIMWKSENWSYDKAAMRQTKQSDDADRRKAAAEAAKKANGILQQSTVGSHPYLTRKGFPSESGKIWDVDGSRKLVVPMRCANRLIGCQLIDDKGEKKFLYGQQSKGAEFTIGTGGVPIFCEGYATGLSIRAAMKAVNVSYTIHVCFSASNVKFIASSNPRGIVVADFDLNGVGEKAAKDADKPYWLSDTIGEDFNDYHLRVGLFRASQSLKQALFSNGNPPLS